MMALMTVTMAFTTAMKQEVIAFTTLLNWEEGQRMAVSRWVFVVQCGLRKRRLHPLRRWFWFVMLVV